MNAENCLIIGVHRAVRLNVRCNTNIQMLSSITCRRCKKLYAQLASLEAQASIAPFNSFRGSLQGKVRKHHLVKVKITKQQYSIQPKLPESYGLLQYAGHPLPTSLSLLA